MTRLCSFAAAVALIFCTAVTATICPAPARAEEDTVISVPSGDAEMNSAISRARASLPEFWAALEAQAAGTEGFALKVAIRDGSATEHFWLNRISRDGDSLTGIIANEPQTVKTVSMGERHSFAAEAISDWMFMRNGKIVGNQTLRPLLKRMPKEQADYYRSLLETP